MYRVANRLDDALMMINEGQSISRAQQAANPKDAGWPESVALTGMVLAQIQGARHAESAAIAAAQEAIDIRRSLAKKSGGTKGTHPHLAVRSEEHTPVPQSDLPDTKESLGLEHTHMSKRI